MNRIYVSLTLLLALSCPAQGMEVLPQSSQNSGSGSTKATLGSLMSKHSGKDLSKILVSSPCPYAALRNKGLEAKEDVSIRIDLSRLSLKQIYRSISDVSADQKKALKVHSLDCHDNENVTDSVLQAIVTAFSGLKSLNLSLCSGLSEDAFGVIARRTDLKKLDVSYTKISPTDLQTIADAVRGLEELDLECCGSLSGDDFGCITQLTNLRKLNVSHTKISNAALQAIARNLHNLEELNLRGCMCLTGNFFGCITQLTNLRKLTVSYTDISAGALQAIADKVKNLEELDLSDAYRLSANDFGPIAPLTHLKKLNVRHTKISPAALRDIVGANPNLEELTVSGTSLDNATIAAIKATKLQLRIVR